MRLARERPSSGIVEGLGGRGRRRGWRRWIGHGHRGAGRGAGSGARALAPARAGAGAVAAAWRPAARLAAARRRAARRSRRAARRAAPARRPDPRPEPGRAATALSRSCGAGPVSPGFASPPSATPATRNTAPKASTASADVHARVMGSVPGSAASGRGTGRRASGVPRRGSGSSCTCRSGSAWRTNSFSADARPQPALEPPEPDHARGARRGDGADRAALAHAAHPYARTARRAHRRARRPAPRAAARFPRYG